jgi:hypothetical protein
MVYKAKTKYNGRYYVTQWQSGKQNADHHLVMLLDSVSYSPLYKTVRFETAAGEGSGESVVADQFIKLNVWIGLIFLK